MKKFIAVFCAVLALGFSLALNINVTRADIGSTVAISPTSFTNISQTISSAVCNAPRVYAGTAAVYIYDNDGNNIFGAGLFDSCQSFNSNYNGMQIGGVTGFVIPDNDSAYDGTWTMVLEQDSSQDFVTLSDALSSAKYLAQSTFSFNY